MKATQNHNFGMSFPELAEEWHPTKNGTLTPYMVMPSSATKVWWKCSNGHEWQASLNKRANHRKCPYCAGKKPTKENNLLMKFPEVAKEWHPTRNGTLTPLDVLPRSGKKYWWVCSNGHEWEALVCNRTSPNPRKCPECSKLQRVVSFNKFVLKRSGSLAQKNPELIKQWHPTKNGILTPFDISPMSRKKVWWICKQGHEWPAIVASRSKGIGCPCCSRRRASKDNNLAVKFPELISEWYTIRNGNLNPLEVAPNSSRKVWWKCKLGHEWQATIANRTRAGSSCPDCHPQTSKLEIRVYCELKKLFKEVLWRSKIGEMEIDIYLPQVKVGIEIDGYPWHKGREKSDLQKSQILSGNGTLLLHIRDEKLRPITQTDIFYKSTERHLEIVRKILKSLMENGHISEKNKEEITDYLKLNQFQNDKEYRLLVSLLPAPIFEKSVSRLFPKLVEEWNFDKNNPLKPSMFTVGSHLRIWWKCDKGHEWPAVLSSRVNGCNCPYCAGKRATKQNNLALKYPELAKEWHPIRNDSLTAYDVLSRSGKKVWWKCSKGHEWQATVDNRIGHGYGCPTCAGRKVSSDNNLGVKYPELVNEWHPTKNGVLTPYDVMPKSHRKVWWKCSKGHEWDASLNDRSNSRSCPYCSGKKASNTNNLGVKFPELIKQWHPTKNGALNPFEVLPMSHKNVWWLCEKGHEWQSIISNRSKGNGCPKCRVKKEI